MYFLITCPLHLPSQYFLLRFICWCQTHIREVMQPSIKHPDRFPIHIYHHSAEIKGTYAVGKSIFPDNGIAAINTKIIRNEIVWISQWIGYHRSGSISFNHQDHISLTFFQNIDSSLTSLFGVSFWMTAMPYIPWKNSQCFSRLFWRGTSCQCKQAKGYHPNKISCFHHRLDLLIPDKDTQLFKRQHDKIYHK